MTHADLGAFYAVLELPAGAPFDEARSAYRDLVRVWHPDRFANDVRLRRRCEEKLKVLNDAYHRIEKAQQSPACATPVKRQPAYANSSLSPFLHRGKWGYVDARGCVCIPQVYDTAADFSEGLAAVSQNGAFGYVNSQGSLAIDLRFSSAGPFSEGLALVKFGRYGYIGLDGEWVIKPRFEAALDIREGLAAVKMDGKWGILDTRGQWVVYPRFDELNPFESGRALAREAGRCYAVFRNGEVRPV
ncbi:MAG: WG repeat-containing protein [Bryobacteraceae bacterium]|nr:WG repeat-containing protein [Bryobacteraceae bacterium]